MEPNSSTSEARPSKAYSCVRCFERKVKCDKQHPCSGCVRSKVECVFRVPPAPRRRKRKAREDDVLARLKHYEELLRDQGIDPTTPSTTPSKVDTTSPPLDDADNSITSISKPAEPSWTPGSLHGRLIIDHGRSRFIQNKLWTTVSEELHHSKDVIQDTDSEDELGTLADDSTDFVLGVTPYPTLTSSLHPSPEHVLKLWQIFLTNVNPLMKIVHQPTLQRTIEDAIQDTDHIPRGLEALMFAIYGAAVLSMRDGECQAIFGESRTILQSRYRLGIRRALTKARFMATSDIVVLQALVIYLLTTRQVLDARTLWTLSGVASRIAQGMGVHRDGTVLGLPPFETEMRRRLWWQINLLDFRAAELSGFGGLTEVNWWNTKTPSNVNDVDIWPGMKEQPVDQTRPTEMVVCLLHYAVGAFWRRKLLQAGTPEEDLNRAMHRWVATKTLAEKDAFVDEFQANLEEKVLRYCDPSMPLEMMALIIGRTMCKSIRFMAHHPRRYANEKDIPDSERQFLWTTSMALMEADNLAHSHRSLQRFSWHIDAGFQWHSFIFALGELIARPTGESKDEAWIQIEDVFKNHPT
ncbi:Fungal Zn2-Cys6 binuclear cluster domain-containing protein [Cladophialophora immunda]|nr:Fungal Zn2-Cys6 binuclear cluster domain-containing protein [Cladophialophora immunda]